MMSCPSGVAISNGIKQLEKRFSRSLSDAEAAAMDREVEEWVSFDYDLGLKKVQNFVINNDQCLLRNLTGRINDNSYCPLEAARR